MFVIEASTCSESSNLVEGLLAPQKDSWTSKTITKISTDCWDTCETFGFGIVENIGEFNYCCALLVIALLSSQNGLQKPESNRNT